MDLWLEEILREEDEENKNKILSYLNEKKLQDN